jgi:hypothetical protein
MGLILVIALFFKLHVGVDIRLGPFHGLMAQPERDHHAIYAVLNRPAPVRLEGLVGGWKS